MVAYHSAIAPLVRESKLELPLCAANCHDARVLVLDHLFVCVDADPHEAEELRRLGFTVEFQREHPGQGTRNHLLLFDEHYLELLWLADRFEAEHSAVRLDRRIDWRTTHASPFGVAMRGPRPIEDVPWVEYRLPGMPSGLLLDGRTLDDPRLPLVFIFEQPDDVEGGPRHGGYPRQFLRHDNGTTRIADVTLEGPGLRDVPNLALPPNVRFVDAPEPRMRLRLTGAELHPTVTVGLVELTWS